MRKLFDIIADNAVPAVFIIISAFAIPLSGYSASYLIQELITRIGRNSFLILSLLIPIMAGMGLNFGMVLGAMAGQIGFLFTCVPYRYTYCDSARNFLRSRPQPRKRARDGNVIYSRFLH